MIRDVIGEVESIVRELEARGDKELVARLINVERDVVDVLSNLLTIKFMIDGLIERYLRRAHPLTDLEQKIVQHVDDCIEINELVRRFSHVDLKVLIFFIMRLKRLRILDVRLDVSGNSILVKVCRTAQI